jgi:predicted amidohydrolase
MKVAAYQAPLLLRSSTEAVELIAEQVKACEAAGVDILCCPEAVLGGLADHSERPADLAIDVESGQLRTRLSPLASDSVTTMVGFTEAGSDGRLFNSAAVFSKNEVVGVYRKIHPAINRSVYTPGAAAHVFRVGGLVFGIAICRDSTFVELVQGMAARGASTVFVPTNNALAPAKGGAEVVEHARRTDVQRAIENAVWVVRADVAGRINGLESYGSSAITGCDGAVRQVARSLEPDLLIADIGVRNRSHIQTEPTRAGL